MSSRKRRVVLPAVLLAMSLVATACGGDDDSDSSSGNGDNGSSSSDVLGAEKKATGEPIKIGFSSEGRGATIDNTEEVEAAKAAAEYVNNYLGGIDGRPLEISLICENKALPATARECGNKFVQSDIVALVSGPTGTVDSVIDVTSPAGLPYFNTGSTQKAMTLPNSFVMGNTLGALIGVPASYAKTEGLKSAAIVTIDVPAAVEPLKQLGALAYGNAGAKTDVVAIAPGTPDMTPQIQGALGKNPGMFQLVGDTAFCTSALKAMRTLNVTQPIVIIPQCIGDDTASQIPGGYKDMIVSTGYVLDEAEEETKVFKAVIDKYTEGKVSTETAPTGYAAVLGFARALTGMTGEITRESLSAFLSKMPAPQPLPLGAGATFQCGTKPITIGPNICSPDAIQAKAEEDGTVVDAKPVDVSELFTLPTG